MIIHPAVWIMRFILSSTPDVMIFDLSEWPEAAAEVWA